LKSWELWDLDSLNKELNDYSDLEEEELEGNTNQSQDIPILAESDSDSRFEDWLNNRSIDFSSSLDPLN
jgi:hypothetical protein